MHFHTTSFRGIGTITRRELDDWFPRKVRDVVPFRVRDYDITSFSTEVPVANLMQLGTAEAGSVPESWFMRLDRLPNEDLASRCRGRARYHLL